MENDLSLASRGEDYYRQILDTAPDAMVVVDPSSTIVFVNVQTEKLFGYRRDELIGQRLEVLIPERFRRGHQSHVARFFTSPSVRPMGSALELFGRRADGSEVAIEVSLSPVRTADGLLVSAAIRDITERQRVQAAARLAAERLASAVESIQDAFALFDSAERLVLCNSVYRRLVAEAAPGPTIGGSFADLLDSLMSEFAFDDETTKARFRADRLAELRLPTSSFDARMRDGRSLRVTSRRTIEGGIVQTIWDLTDDVRREQELREARAAAEAGSAAKSEFLSSMSHELRTPLNAILGFAQLLRRDRREPLSERHKERVEQILRGGEHLLRLIDDVLDLSRIEAGGVSISPEPVGVREVLEEVRQTLEPMAARTGVRIVAEAVPAGLPMITADRTRFAQILMNFGSNAIKYNRPEGTVTFRVAQLDPAFVRVTVSDTGFGIAPDKHAKLFQPFQRAGQETGPIEGTGIGLTITKRLAELMQGRVGFRSVVGEGSTFWVDMPAQAAVASAQPVPHLRGEGTGQFGGAARHLVLYVEDNPANVSFMRDLLGSFEGIELVTTTTAEAGLEVARARVPSVILMDINLPGMSGLDALKALRQWPETQHIPVVALTAAASARDRQRGEEAGFYRYLTKPIKVDELEAALETLLNAQ